MAYKKPAVFILITAVFVSSAYSVNASDWFYATKEFGLDLAGRAIASTLIRALSNKLIQKIQTGGEGGRPSFVQNWRNFLTDSQYRGEDVFRTILYSTSVCSYLDKDIKGLFGANSKSNSTGQNLRVDSFDPFSLRANCTLPSSFNMASYQQDFSGNGGWQAWDRLLEPQNNYYGLLFQSLDEAARQRDIEAQAGQSEAQAGSGYTSIRGNCQDELTGTGQEGPNVPSRARCTFMGKVFTPADLLGKTAATAIDKDMEGIINSDELAETLIAIGNAVIGRLANLAGSVGADTTTEILANDESLKNEYCSSKFPSQEALDKYGKDPRVIAAGMGSSYDRAKFKKSGYKSPCEKVKDQYGTDNPYPYQRCIIACFKALEIIPEEVIVPSPPPIPTDEPLPPEEEPSLSCEEQGLTENYKSNVGSAISSFITANPDVAGKPDDDEGGPNNTAFINGVVNTLVANGFTAGRLLHVATGKLSGDKIIVGHNPPDIDGEVYDIILGTGDGKPFNASNKTSDGCVSHADWSKLVPASGGSTPTGLSGNIRSDFSSCTKGTNDCDVVLNYTTQNASSVEIRKNGSVWRTITDNIPAGTQVDSSPSTGTYTYTLYGYTDNGSTPSLLSSVTVIIN